MNHKFWGGFETYLGQYIRNKMMVKFPEGEKASAKNAVALSRKVYRTSTSTKDVSKSCSCNQ